MIVNQSNLRQAYEILNTLSREFIPKGGKLESYMADLKRSIRACTNSPAPDSRIVKEYGIDGYIELYTFPEELASATRDEAEEWFDENCRFSGGGGQYDCTGVEDALDVTMAQRSELDYLIYNDPLGYADLILNGDPKEYLRNAAGSHGLED